MESRGKFITVIPELNLVVAHKTNVNILGHLGIIENQTSNDTYFKVVDLTVNAKQWYLVNPNLMSALLPQGIFDLKDAPGLSSCSHQAEPGLDIILCISISMQRIQWW